MATSGRPRNQFFGEQLDRLMVTHDIGDTRVSRYLTECGHYTTPRTVYRWRQGYTTPARWDQILPLLGKLLQVLPEELVCPLDSEGYPL